VLAAQRDRLSGTVLLVFQPAEEVGLGARAMIEDGVMEFAGAPVDAALGLHLISALSVGTVAVCPGPSMASSDTFEIVLTGRGGHGAMPQQCIDPISTGAELVLALQRIVSRELSALTPAVLSTCVFQSGSASNIIPQEARLAGTIRAYAPEVRAAIHEKVERITAGVSAAGGTTYELTISEGTPPVVNDLAMCELVREAASLVVGADHVVQPEPMLPSDDVALFLDRVPGCYFNVGSGNPAQGTDFPHHHPRFDLSEESLLIAAAVLSEAATRYLR
jgi:amidohydrolase